jgi:hypothetical protein
VLQREQEEVLKRREQELAEREIELVERELNIMILQQIMNKPTPKKRKGKFRKSRLKMLKASGGKIISQPSGEFVQVYMCSTFYNLFFFCRFPA